MVWEYPLALRQRMNSALQRLIQAAIALEEAKQHRDKEDKEAQKRYEQRIEEAAQQGCEVDPATAPTVAFLELRACQRGLENSIRNVWEPFLDESLLALVSSLNPQAELIEHPKAWRIALKFVLHKPYLSKDDRDFYLLDNSVRKEWVFQVPYVAPSQWKGALRAAMRRLRGCPSWQQEAEDEQMIRLFGNIKGEENRFSTGWLHFYPTYFDRIGLEVINPHPRDTGAGKQPIYFECVPPGTEGTFMLLYVPLEEVDEAKAKEDFRAVAQGLKAMFTKYGFGAKTSSGFGRAHAHWKKEEEAEVQPEEKLWDEWERIWKEDP